MKKRRNPVNNSRRIVGQSKQEPDSIEFTILHAVLFITVHPYRCRGNNKNNKQTNKQTNRKVWVNDNNRESQRCIVDSKRKGRINKFGNGAVDDFCNSKQQQIIKTIVKEPQFIRYKNFKMPFF